MTFFVPMVYADTTPKRVTRQIMLTVRAPLNARSVTDSQSERMAVQYQDSQCGHGLRGEPGSRSACQRNSAQRPTGARHIRLGRSVAGMTERIAASVRRSGHLRANETPALRFGRAIRLATEPVLKTGEAQALGGSTPSPSATESVDALASPRHRGSPRAGSPRGRQVPGTGRRDVHNLGVRCDLPGKVGGLLIRSSSMPAGEDEGARGSSPRNAAGLLVTHARRFGDRDALNRNARERYPRPVTGALYLRSDNPPHPGFCARSTVSPAGITGVQRAQWRTKGEA